MTPRIQQLLDLGGPPLLPGCWQHASRKLAADSRVGASELCDLLSVKNGFYGFEAALLVRPIGHSGVPLGIREWNVPGLWKCEYGGSLDDALCFAEDVFGVQFALSREGIVAIDPETGQLEQLASTLEEWAGAILTDCNYRTGYPLAHDWQRQNGPLTPGHRLLPKIPFVTGGEFVLENLYSAVDVEGMRFRGSVARQIHDVPDGGYVVFQAKPPRAP